MSYNLEDLLGNRALTAKKMAHPFLEERLNSQAQLVRDWLALVVDTSHLKDLYQEFKGRHPKSACEDLWNYYRFIARLASPQITDEYFSLAVGFFAPVVERNAVFALGAAERAERKKISENSEKLELLHKEKRGDIEKIDAGSSEHSVHQYWVASKREYLEYERDYQYARYHPSGYGTRCEEFFLNAEGQYKGKYTCKFYRGTSCD